MADGLRVPPQDLIMEMTVLGSLMIDGERVREVCDLLTPGMFYNVKHARVYEVILELSGQEMPVDIETVSSRLVELGELERVGGNAALATMVEGTPTPKNVKFYARRVQEMALKRLVIEGANEMVEGAYGEGKKRGMTADELVVLVNEKVEAITHEGQRGRMFLEPPKDIKTLVNDYLQTLDEVMDSGRTPGVSTGFPELDKYMFGYRPGKLIVVGARAKQGKTSFAVSSGDSVVREGHYVLMVTYEMLEDEIIARVVSQRACIDGLKIAGFTMNAAELDRHAEACREVEGSKWIIRRGTERTLPELKTIVTREMTYNPEIKLVIVDYLGLLSSHEEFSNRSEFLGRVTSFLKQFAANYGVCVLLLSQLNRGSEAVTPRAPRLSDLRESGNIEQDADAVIMIYRPGELDDTYTKEYTRIMLVGNRNGPTRDIDGTFRRKYTQFVEGYESGEWE